MGVVETAIAEAQQRKRDHEQREARQAQVRRMEQIAVFKTDLCVVLGVELVQELAFLYGVDSRQTQATLTIGTESIAISRYSEAMWQLSRSMRGIERYADPAALRDAFLVHLGEMLAQAERVKRKREAEERERQERDAYYEQCRIEREQREQEEACERERKQTEIKATHERLARQVSEQVEQARRALWHWPEGREITLYFWRWQTGRYDEGCEYDDGWSVVDVLDADGWLLIGNGRRIKLIPDVHLPTCEAQVFRSTRDLPSALRTTKYIEIHGVARWRPQYDDEYWYVDQSGSSVQEPIGEVPVSWVQQVVDR